MTICFEHSLLDINKSYLIEGQLKSIVIMTTSLEKLKEEFFNVRIFELIKTSSYIIEKVFWFLIFLSVTIWFFYFTSTQSVIRHQNSMVSSNANLKLSDVNYPAISFCSRAANKYGIAERFGNYLNPEAHLDHEFLSWVRKVAMNCSFEIGVWKTKDYIGIDPAEPYGIYKTFCSWEFYYSCQVSTFTYSHHENSLNDF